MGNQGTHTETSVPWYPTKAPLFKRDLISLSPRVVQVIRGMLALVHRRAQAQDLRLDFEKPTTFKVGNLKQVAKALSQAYLFSPTQVEQILRILAQHKDTDEHGHSHHLISFSSKTGDADVYLDLSVSVCTTPDENILHQDYHDELHYSPLIDELWPYKAQPTQATQPQRSIQKTISIGGEQIVTGEEDQVIMPQPTKIIPTPMNTETKHSTEEAITFLRHVLNIARNKTKKRLNGECLIVGQACQIGRVIYPDYQGSVGILVGKLIQRTSGIFPGAMIKVMNGPPATYGIRQEVVERLIADYDSRGGGKTATQTAVEDLPTGGQPIPDADATGDLGANPPDLEVVEVHQAYSGNGVTVEPRPPLSTNEMTDDMRQFRMSVHGHATESEGTSQPIDTERHLPTIHDAGGIEKAIPPFSWVYHGPERQSSRDMLCETLHQIDYEIPFLQLQMRIKDQEISRLEGVLEQLRQELETITQDLEKLRARREAVETALKI